VNGRADTSKDVDGDGWMRDWLLPLVSVSVTALADERE